MHIIIPLPQSSASHVGVLSPASIINDLQLSFANGIVADIRTLMIDDSMTLGVFFQHLETTF